MLPLLALTGCWELQFAELAAIVRFSAAKIQMNNLNASRFGVFRIELITLLTDSAGDDGDCIRFFGGA